MIDHSGRRTRHEALARAVPEELSEAVEAVGVRGRRLSARSSAAAEAAAQQPATVGNQTPSGAERATVAGPNQPTGEAVGPDALTSGTTGAPVPGPITRDDGIEPGPAPAGDAQAGAGAAPAVEQADARAAEADHPSPAVRQDTTVSDKPGQDPGPGAEDERERDLERYIRTGRLPAGYRSLELWLGEDAEQARAEHEDYLEALMEEHDTTPAQSMRNRLTTNSSAVEAATEAGRDTTDHEVPTEPLPTATEHASATSLQETVPATGQAPSLDAATLSVTDRSAHRVGTGGAPLPDRAVRSNGAEAPSAAALTDTVVEAFEGVQAAWADHVPIGHGTAEDLLAAIEADLRVLREAWQRTAPRPQNHLPAAGTATLGQPPAPSDRQPTAEAVGTALHRADEHASTLSHLPEWQELQTIRGAARNLWHTLRQRAGQYADRLFDDTRVQGFLRTIGIRTFEAISNLAHNAADRLRRERGDLPSAEALLALGNAAGAYSTAQRGRGSLPSAQSLLSLGDEAFGTAAPAPTTAPSANEVSIPPLQKLGKALRKPLPEQKSATTSVSVAAARARSTTGRAPKKAATSASEQAASLRRGAAETQRTRKPNHR